MMGEGLLQHAPLSRLPLTQPSMLNIWCSPLPASGARAHRLLASRLVAPFARRLVELRAERLVEMRQVVEAPAIGDFGNVQGALIAVAQRVAAGLEPVLDH